MKTFLPIVTILLAGVSIAATQEVSAPTRAEERKTAAEKLLIENENAIYGAIKNHDAKKFLSLFSSDGLWADGALGGFVPIDALMKSGFDGIEIQTFEIINPRVFWIDNTSAIVNYAWSGKKTIQAQPLGAASRFASTVWTKRDDRWLAVYHHESDLAR